LHNSPAKKEWFCRKLHGINEILDYNGGFESLKKIASINKASIVSPTKLKLFYNKFQ